MSALLQHILNVLFSGLKNLESGLILHMTVLSVECQTLVKVYTDIANVIHSPLKLHLFLLLLVKVHYLKPLFCDESTLLDIELFFGLCVDLFSLFIGLLFNEGHHVLDLQVVGIGSDKMGGYWSANTSMYHAHFKSYLFLHVGVTQSHLWS